MSDPALFIVVCGAPLAARVGDGVREARERGWTPVVVPTAAARRWVDVASLDGALVREEFESTSGDTPEPAAVAVVPATFNTLNAWANGQASTYPLTMLCAALGARTPTVAVPFAKQDLTGHPAWLASLAVLRYAGVQVVDPQSGALGNVEAVASGTGESVADNFQWKWVYQALERPE